MSVAAARKPVLGLDPGMVAAAPEIVAKEKRSYTGQFLKPVLARGDAGLGKKQVEAAE